MKSLTLRTTCLILTTMASGLAGPLHAGNLNPPPGPPTSTMKTLVEVEPRTPIATLPYTISQPGSYYLTQDLTASGAGDSIIIQANDVTLDLSGFTLDGGPLGQIGICVCGAPTFTNWVIRNGTLRNWFSSGVSAANVDGVRIEGLSLINSGLQGLILGDHARVTDTFVAIQGGSSTDGIAVGQQSILERCTVSGAPSNGRGITTGADSLVNHCTVKGFNIGIRAGGGIRLSHSIVSLISFSGVGLELQNSSTVEDNTFNCLGDDGSRGIFVRGNNNRIDGNHILGCTTGLAFDFGLVFGTVVFHNSFSNNFQDVFAPMGNSVAPIENVAVSMNPWANLTN